MSDGTKRKLTMPPWHTPYLEKHRIYDLFHELAREIVIQQPEDHLLFLKNILNQAAKSRDVSRLIILSSPKVNGYEVASQISYITKQTLIGERTILSTLEKKDRKSVSSRALARCIAHLTRQENVHNTGWILLDCVKTGPDAKAILAEGILPTHVIHLIPPFSPPLNELLYCNVHEWWPEYRRTIMAVRDIFKHCLMEVHFLQKNIDEIVQECVNLTKIRKGFGGPKQPRILLLGPRGCGRKTQANLLANHLNVIHIDFEYLLCQEWISQTELGEELRACKEEVCFQSDLLVKVVSQRVLEKDCMEKGWVLTGFPYTVTDFKYLDCIDTPPNRVIFLDCDLNICRERLQHRRINAYTGSLTDLLRSPDFVLGKVLAVHPKDKKSIIDAELHYYCEHYGPLRNYCGETATVVNGEQQERWVLECIAAAVVRPLPPCAPRQPCATDSGVVQDGGSDYGSTNASQTLKEYINPPNSFVM